MPAQGEDRRPPQGGHFRFWPNWRPGYRAGKDKPLDGIDLLAIAREWESVPPLDPSDGSSSWFEMSHEEALVLDRQGQMVARIRESEGRIIYPATVVSDLTHGGLSMHSQPTHDASSFGFTDVATLLFYAASDEGMAMVVTTSHPVDGSMCRVRYTMDTRGLAFSRLMDPVQGSRPAFEHAWERYATATAEQLDTLSVIRPELSSEELYALYYHGIVQRVAEVHGFVYRREVLDAT
jgi:hypothetical protein